MMNRSSKHKVWQGANRIVYDMGNGTVLKLAKSKSGIKSNRNEVKLYRSSPYLLTKYLGRIKEYHYKYEWLIMKKYGQKFLGMKGYKQKLAKVRTRFKKYGILPIDTLKNRKPKHQNLRVKRNGRIAIIDYGHFKSVR